MTDKATPKSTHVQTNVELFMNVIKSAFVAIPTQNMPVRIPNTPAVIINPVTMLYTWLCTIPAIIVMANEAMSVTKDDPARPHRAASIVFLYFVSIFNYISFSDFQDMTK